MMPSKSAGYICASFQSLATAGRATIPVIELRRTAINRRDDGFVLHGHCMYGAKTEVDQFIVMPKCEACAAASVPSVSGRCGITASQRLSHGSVTDGTGPASVADSLKLSVPAGRGQPDFDFDVRITSWLK